MSKHYKFRLLEKLISIKSALNKLVPHLSIIFSSMLSGLMFKSARTCIRLFHLLFIKLILIYLMIGKLIKYHYFLFKLDSDIN